MIWLKRILPFVIIALGWYGWEYYTKMQMEKFEAEQEKYALVLAKAWVASAIYRKHPDEFITYRDSVMKSVGLTNEDFKAYVEKHKAEPEILGPFTEKVKQYTDSLIKIEDSLRVVRDSLKIDSIPDLQA